MRILLTRAALSSVFYLSSSPLPLCQAFGCCSYHPASSFVARTFVVSSTAITRIRGGGSANANNDNNKQQQQCLSKATARNMASTAEVADAATATTTTTPKYDALISKLDDITQLTRASSVLSYDELVFMPHTDYASAQRGKQSAALAAVIHEKSTDPGLGSMIKDAEQELASIKKDDNDIKHKLRNVELARIDYNKHTCVPTELASKQAALKSEAYTKWNKAREADDFEQFEDVLGRCIALATEVADLQRQGIDPSKSIYETMLDEYEMGMHVSRIDTIFDEIKTALVPLIEKVLGDSKATPPSKAPLEGKFDVEAQKLVSQQIVKDIGFNPTNGRIDVSVHPFTMSLNPNDVRITSRFRDDEWFQGLAGTIHEGGHAIYEQNLASPTTTRTTSEPMDGALSMGTHESQSLFWERHIGLSKSFWKYATPIVNEKFNINYSADEYYGAVNAASKSYIRVEADELTYPLHVVLRYEIERDFIQGKLDVTDLPERWNRDFSKLLGLAVPSAAKGCLQDIHWSAMAFGYFPTYLVGSATAAQLAHYCHQDIPDMDEKIANGDFADIKAWLTAKIHKHGKKYKSLDEHLEAEIGEKLNPKYFIDYLTNKYTELYKV